MSQIDVVDSKRTDRARPSEDGQLTDEFIATLAHELRSPLAVILTNAEFMRQCDGDERSIRQAVEVVERQARHMARIIDDVLDVCRGRHGKLALRVQFVNLTAVVADAVEAVRPLIASRGHDLTVSLPPETPSLLSDPSRLQQILFNLLTNAAKYTDPGGRIWLTLEQAGEAAVLRVRDTGIGITPGMLPHIFDLFAQSDRAIRRSDMGLGVGLALVRQLVEGLGGTVSAFSAGVGQGSEFVVRFPKTQTLAAERDSHGQATETEGTKVAAME